ncbi:hypothetical protein, partial [Salinivibrio kushneri]|uniref:hypothetical protein n=1 Tax=Salinivibrio kushneri TaxID=1908198 RepID=UPI0009D60D8A
TLGCVMATAAHRGHSLCYQPLPQSWGALLRKAMDVAPQLTALPCARHCAFILVYHSRTVKGQGRARALRRGGHHAKCPANNGPQAHHAGLRHGHRRASRALSLLSTPAPILGRPAPQGYERRTATEQRCRALGFVPFVVVYRLRMLKDQGRVRALRQVGHHAKRPANNGPQAHQAGLRHGHRRASRALSLLSTPAPILGRPASQGYERRTATEQRCRASTIE